MGAEDGANHLDAGAKALASFQDQINAMNETGASFILVAPFDEVKVTGVRQNPYPQSLTNIMVTACPGLNGVHPKGSYGAIMQWCAAQVDSGISLRNIPPQFGDQLSPGDVPQPEMNSNVLLGLRQHTSAFGEGLQSPRGLLKKSLLPLPAASPNVQASLMNNLGHQVWVFFFSFSGEIACVTHRRLSSATTSTSKGCYHPASVT